MLPLVFSILCACYVIGVTHALPVDSTERTIDQLISNWTGAPKDGDFIDDRFILIGRDILVTKSQYRDMFSEDKRPHQVKGHGVQQQMLWPGGVVPYMLDPSLAGDKNKILSAMKEWERVTCIRFRQATSSDRTYIRIQGGQGCNSYVGAVPGWRQQPLNLQYPGCWDNKIILHELGHAIGLHHEMSHPNAGRYIDIQFQNIKQDCQREYQVQGGTNTYGFDYDLMSIMHYGAYDCSVGNGQLLTVKTKDPSKQSLVGSAKTLSKSDIGIVNKMYQGTCGTTGTGGTGNTCQDRVPGCTPYYCGNPQYATQSCPRTCGRCTNTGTGQCVDRNPSCAYWASVGECMRNPNFMVPNCPRSCRRCF